MFPLFWWCCLWVCSLVFWIVFARTRRFLRDEARFTPGWLFVGWFGGMLSGLWLTLLVWPFHYSIVVCIGCWLVCGGLVVVVGLLVICIVVASIFFVCFVGFFSFCGRLVDALVPRADEGRCGLRYSLGSWRASVDPGVSEWGNLTGFVACYHCLNV